MTVFAGILHDTYPDENGKEIAYTEKIVAVRKKGFYKCTSLPDFDTFEMSAKDFSEKVSELRVVFN